METPDSKSAGESFANKGDLSSMSEKNILQHFWEQVKKKTSEPALYQKRLDKDGRTEWQPMTWGELGENVARFASARAMSLPAP